MSLGQTLLRKGGEALCLGLQVVVLQLLHDVPSVSSALVESQQGTKHVFQATSNRDVRPMLHGSSHWCRLPWKPAFCKRHFCIWHDCGLGNCLLAHSWIAFWQCTCADPLSVKWELTLTCCSRDSNIHILKSVHRSSRVWIQLIASILEEFLT